MSLGARAGPFCHEAALWVSEHPQGTFSDAASSSEFCHGYGSKSIEEWKCVWRTRDDRTTRDP
jgi:hypothetical protein